jgi:hypothetical protein
MVEGDLYYGVDVREAVLEMLEAALENWRQIDIVKDAGIAIVVLNPLSDVGEEWFELTLGPEDEHALRRRLDFARRKTHMVHRLGFDSSWFVHNDRHLLREGDVPYAGGVKRTHVIVGVSGMTQDEDHWIAELVAGFIVLTMQKVRDAYVAAHPEERILIDPFSFELRTDGL